MASDRQPTAAPSRGANPYGSKVGLLALWGISLFVTICLVILSLIEGAAERKRLRNAPKNTKAVTPSQPIGRSIASDA